MASPNTIRVENNYGTYGYAYNPNAAFIYDASYVKLREMVLSYALPQTWVAKTKIIKGAEFSVIGRNLWIIHKNLPLFRSGRKSFFRQYTRIPEWSLSNGKNHWS
jgi:hypothetical protein